ncbi:Alpha-L-Rha alpha-1,3-L-rhamnosyltransferase [hydrothermal vent metagenome]|uniref:Alpha-L-Rha alpha-1,3-L-rhamnosyltransferase n=1 Tax=hydrothermal vent metagenome TaxID=652676 RepID=A0A3B0VQG6_9ZZZZ
MKISIALATYNGEKYLNEQLQSYKIQEKLPDEIISCDDVSIDATVDILEHFARGVLFKVKVIKNSKNLGYTKNFEKAISLCSGDLILLSDQDDVWLPQKINHIESLFLKNPNISLVIHDGELVDENLNGDKQSKLNQLKSAGFSEKQLATGALTAINKNILPLILPFASGISGGHDGWIHAIASLTNRRMVDGKVLQKLRRHETNTSQWIVNSLTKINKIDKIMSQINTKPAISYSDRIHTNECLTHRFKEYESGDVILDFEFDVTKVLQQLSKELLSLNKRQSLLSKRFWQRKFRALSMLFLGDYKHFNGLKSFIRDVLR